MQDVTVQNKCYDACAVGNALDPSAQATRTQAVEALRAHSERLIDTTAGSAAVANNLTEQIEQRLEDEEFLQILKDLGYDPSISMALDDSSEGEEDPTWVTIRYYNIESNHGVVESTTLMRRTPSVETLAKGVSFSTPGRVMTYAPQESVDILASELAENSEGVPLINHIYLPEEGNNKTP